MLKRLSFRSKLLAVLIVPFVALVAIAVPGMRDRFSTLQAEEQYGQLAGPLARLDTLSRAVENEAVVSSWSVAGGAPTADLFAARSRTDVAAKAFDADRQVFVDSDVGVSGRVALNQVDRSLRGLTGLRDRVDARSVDAEQVRTAYLGVDSDLLTFGERVARAIDAPQTSAAVTRTFALQRAEHELTRESSIQIVALATGDQASFSEWVSAFASRQRAIADFATSATTEERGAFTPVGIGTDVINPPTTFPAVPATPSDMLGQYQTLASMLDDAIDAVNTTIQAASDHGAESARSAVWFYGVGVSAAMLLTLGLMWFASRSVVRPVRRLTEAARNMSERQLPALVSSLRSGGDISGLTPTLIEVESDDEIGALAQAFNDVESVTFDVARQQSVLLRKGMGDLFVNLARRNQTLLERQLELLDELERNEHDPADLDSLFKLDHMATRMRRNAESLLVLSGAEQPRQWRDAVGLLDVVRSAAAEISDFPRVSLAGIDERVAVSGRAVSDVAHLLAELLENATVFSSPESEVVVSGAITKSGYVLAITDRGIGMQGEQLTAVNQLLRNPPAVGLAISRALGLHVVGALAKRHGIAVELRRGLPDGTVALIALPRAILEARQPQTPPAGAAPVQPVVQPVVQPPVQPPVQPVVQPVVQPPVQSVVEEPVVQPPDEPPVEQWRREGIERDGGPASPAVDVASNGTHATPPVGQPAPEESPGAPLDHYPLPTRVPGANLAHTPAAPGGEPVDEHDPIRPFRVHEMLARHTQGVKHGRQGEATDDPAPDPAPNASAESPLDSPLDQSENLT